MALFSKSFTATSLLTLGMVFWGMTFVFIKESISHISPYAFIYNRFFIASIALALLFCFRLRLINKKILIYGLILGIILALTIITQTIGIQYTTASKSAFIASLSIIFVPIINSIRMRKTPNAIKIACILLSLLGVTLLTLGDTTDIELNKGDLYVLLGAFCFSFHIILVDRYSRKEDPILLSLVQFVLVGVAALLCSWQQGDMSFPTHYIAWKGILFCALFATVFTFTVQNYYQRYISSPYKVAIIFALEPLFAAFTGYFYLGETMSTKGIIGGALIFIAMCIPDKQNKA